MSQDYVNPHDIVVPAEHAERRPSRSLLRILARDGQIVPLLVTRLDGRYVTADTWQSERVLALRELGWPTVLVEDEWTEDDL